ncbi:hypothetical protein HIM_02479 [Hirsutella minnesotensis 3608]|nr:hypothetical protein HIM_02479 [Hirsutella minnesotensis 3608]
MRFTISVSALLAMASSALAQVADFDPIYTPTSNQQIPAGQPFTITWDAKPQYQNEMVNIRLIGGETQGTQVPLMTITSRIPNSQKTFTWNVPANLGDKKFYGLVIESDANKQLFQYSNPFHIVGGKAAPSSTPAPAPQGGVKTIVLSSASPAPAPYATPVAPKPAVTQVAAPVEECDCTKTKQYPGVAKPTGVAVPTSIVPITNGTAPGVVPVAGASMVRAGALSVVVGLAAAAVAL